MYFLYEAHLIPIQRTKIPQVFYYKFLCKVDNVKVTMKNIFLMFSFLFKYWEILD